MELTDEMIKGCLSRNLHALQSAWALTDTGMGEVLSVSRMQFHNFQRGRNLPKLSVLVRLEVSTGVAIRRWLCEEIAVGEFPAVPGEVVGPSLLERVERLERAFFFEKIGGYWTQKEHAGL